MLFESMLKSKDCYVFTNVFLLIFYTSLCSRLSERIEYIKVNLSLEDTSYMNFGPAEELVKDYVQM